jgi:hypothetical protein
MPRDDAPLTDEQVHDRLVAAAEALGDAAGATTRGDTAITTARQALLILQISLVKAAEDAAGDPYR